MEGHLLSLEQQQMPIDVVGASLAERRPGQPAPAAGDDGVLVTRRGQRGRLGT
jgi:hypothetical protein